MFMIGTAAMLLLASCKSSPKVEERVCNIYGGLQDNVEAILQRHLSEYDAMDGVVIVMETNSGRIRGMVGLECKDDSSYVRADSLADVRRSSALVQTVSMLAALNSGKVKQDTNEKTPMQLITLYNAIANNGKMVAPQLYDSLRQTNEEAKVSSPQMASSVNIKDIQKMLEENVTNGQGKKAQSDLFAVAGKDGTTYNKDSTLTADFCGYFPARNPVYTVLVSVHRKEIPASGGGMAGAIFKEIAEFLYHNKDSY